MLQIVVYLPHHGHSCGLILEILAFTTRSLALQL